MSGSMDADDARAPPPSRKMATPPPGFARASEEEGIPQLEQSRRLNSEGLEVGRLKIEFCLGTPVLEWNQQQPGGDGFKERHAHMAETNHLTNHLTSQGLPSRASELLKLGLSFFLAFGPFIAAVVLASLAVYSVFGDNFVHSGRPATSPPVYYDPDALLAEPTVDPMVPL